VIDVVATHLALDIQSEANALVLDISVRIDFAPLDLTFCYLVVCSTGCP